MIERLISILAPHRCSSCGEIGPLLCDSCKENIIEDPFSGCLFCGKPSGPRGLCNLCQGQFPFDQAWCVGERKGALKQLGDAYKFDSRRAGAATQAELLDSCVPLLPKGTVIVGVPTLTATVRVRGFDHVGLVAQEFAGRRGAIVEAPLRRDSTVTLHFLKRDERKIHMKELFSLRGEAPEAVLLVDDILTTGTTLQAAARLLKKAGTKQLYAAVIARQPFDR